MNDEERRNWPRFIHNFDYLPSKMVDPLLQIRGDELAPTRLDSDGKTKLTDLNEDCLREIFSFKVLSLMDLCSLAETCTQFREITQLVAPKEVYFDVVNNGCYIVKADNFSIEWYEHEQVRRILTNIGSVLTAITIYGRKRNCHNEPLSCFIGMSKISIWDRNVSRYIDIVPLFNRLKKFHMSYVSVYDDVASLFCGLHSLVELRVVWVKNCRAILCNDFPNLERFYYRAGCTVTPEKFNNSNDEISLDTIKSFFLRHQKLNKLDLNIDCDDDCKIILPQLIAANCIELTEFSIDLGDTTTDALEPLKVLKSLYTLRLWNVTCNSFEFCSDMTELRDMRLIYCDLPDDTSKFSALTQVTRLELNSRYGDTNDIPGIICHMLNLRNLSFPWRYDFVLDEKSYDKIIEIVQHRPHILTIECNFNFNVKKCDENNPNVKLNLASIVD